MYRKIADYAIVLGLGVNGLGQVRSLSHKGIKVIGIYTDRSEWGRYSRLCKVMSFSAEKENTNKFKEKLIILGRRIPEKPVLFAESDFYVNFISEGRDELERYFSFNLPNKETLSMILNKHLIKKVAEENGLPVPKTFHMSSNEDLTNIYAKVSYPCLIKPINSFTTDFPYKNMLINSAKDLKEFYHFNPQYVGKTIVQELISGDDDNIYQCTVYCDRNSIPLSVFTMRKIRQDPPFLGITSYGISTKVTEIIDKTLTFLNNINYMGFCSLEFKWDEKKKKYLFIEMNPRLPWYNSLFYASGINFPYIAYLDQKYLNTNKEVKTEQKEQICWINFRSDLSSYWGKKSLRNNVSIRHWGKSVLRANSYAYWEKTDPLPFLKASQDFGKNILYKICQLIPNHS